MKVGVHKNGTSVERDRDAPGVAIWLACGGIVDLCSRRTGGIRMIRLGSFRIAGRARDHPRRPGAEKRRADVVLPPELHNDQPLA